MNLVADMQNRAVLASDELKSSDSSLLHTRIGGAAAVLLFWIYFLFESPDVLMAAEWDQASCGTHFFSPLVFPLSPLATWKSQLDYIKISASNWSHSPSDRTHRARIVFI
jgi:hypothetical protein